MERYGYELRRCSLGSAHALRYAAHEDEMHVGLVAECQRWDRTYATDMFVGICTLRKCDAEPNARPILARCCLP